MTDTIQFEARKLRYSQSKDGMVVSFLINPHDCPASLATADLGTIYIIRAQQNESGSWIEEQASASERPPAVHAAQQRLEETAAPSKPHRDWSSLPPATQAGIRCGEQQFQDFLNYDYHQISITTTDTASAVREICGVLSRKELNVQAAAAKRWRALECEYQTWKVTMDHAETYR